MVLWCRFSVTPLIKTMTSLSKQGNGNILEPQNITCYLLQLYFLRVQLSLLSLQLFSLFLEVHGLHVEVLLLLSKVLLELPHLLLGVGLVLLQGLRRRRGDGGHDEVFDLLAWTDLWTLTSQLSGSRNSFLFVATRNSCKDTSRSLLESTCGGRRQRRSFHV